MIRLAFASALLGLAALITPAGAAPAAHSHAVQSGAAVSTTWAKFRRSHVQQHFRKGRHVRSHARRRR